MKANALLVLTLISHIVYSQDYCVRKSDLSYQQINKLFPFSETKEIRLVSFKQTLSKKGDSIYKVPEKNGKVDLKGFFETVTLNKRQSAELSDILMNHGFDPKITGEYVYTGEVLMCYNPRNAIIFISKKNEVLGYIEICYECGQYEIYPQDFQVGDFCRDKFQMTKNFFKRIGILYGIEARK